MALNLKTEIFSRDMLPKYAPYDQSRVMIFQTVISDGILCDMNISFIFNSA